MAARSLIVLPDDTPAGIVAAITGAKTSLRVKMFVFSDPVLLAAVVDARKRGVHVQVMLNPARRTGEEDNSQTRATLLDAGVIVSDTNPAFGLTHEKSLVVDDTVAYVNSLNWTTKNLTATRDYAIVTPHPKEVREIVACFDADWHRQPFDAGSQARLVWCPGNGRERICHFIDQAKHTLFVQNERYQDMIVIERLVRAASRGVKVHVMVRAPHTLKLDKLAEGVGGLRILNDVGIKVRKLKHMKLHGKMFVADGETSLIGSINLAPGSLDNRRELSIEANDAAVIKRLEAVAHHDWKHSAAVDLSDEGLLNDIGSEATDPLVLDDDPTHDHTKH
jgi:phosphatidylserine/phosphatidylglycerophosphate/cardiolipin synthase-like enzyme